MMHRPEPKDFGTNANQQRARINEYVGFAHTGYQPLSQRLFDDGRLCYVERYIEWGSVPELKATGRPMEGVLILDLKTDGHYTPIYEAVFEILKEHGLIIIPFPDGVWFWREDHRPFWILLPEVMSPTLAAATYSLFEQLSVDMFQNIVPIGGNGVIAGPYPGGYVPDIFEHVVGCRMRKFKRF